MPVTEAMTAFDPNRSITELKRDRSTPACCGREVLCSLETGRRLQWDRDVNLLKEGVLTPIRIRTRDKWSHSRNSLNKRRLWRIVHEP